MFVVNTEQLHQAWVLIHQLPLNELHLSSKGLPQQYLLFYAHFDDTLRLHVQRLSNHLQQSILAYHQVEQSLQNQSDSFFQMKEWTTRTYIHTSISDHKSILSYLENGVCVGGFASIAWRTWNHRSSDFLHPSLRLSVGDARARGDIECTLFDQKTFSPTLHILAEAGVSVGQARLACSQAFRYLSVEGEAIADVGTIKAEGHACINKDGISLKGEVGAAALKGEARGSITILGVTISARGTAELGSVGIGAEFTSKKGEFSFGAKGSLLAGLGFDVKVDY